MIWKKEDKPLVRHFSALGHMQKEHELSYCIEPAAKGYILKLVEVGDTRREEALLLGADESTAYMLQRFLYENAVPIENWKDVVADELWTEKTEVGGE